MVYSLPLMLSQCDISVLIRLVRLRDPTLAGWGIERQGFRLKR